MVFQRERDLQLHLAAMTAVFSESFGVTFSRREVPLGRCIPDLIYVRLAEMPPTKILPRHTSYQHSYILWLLKQHGRMHLDTLAALSYDSVERIKPLATDLLRAGSIIETDGSLQLAPTLESLECEIVAVEAKMKDWRQALVQAESYQEFADRVFVAMDPSGVPTKLDVIQLFRERQIGLCGVGQDITWIVYPPLHRQPLGPDHEYLLASALAPARQHLWERRYSTKASHDDVAAHVEAGSVVQEAMYSKAVMGLAPALQQVLHGRIYRP